LQPVFQKRKNWNMKMRMIIAVALATLSANAACAQAPAQLRGKSVTASWTEEREQRVGDEKEFSPRSAPMTLNVYISSEGRVFAKQTALGTGGSAFLPRGTGSRESVGSESAGGHAAHVSGRTLIVTDQMAGGARMARIEFSQDFSTCAANVILGREGANTIAKSRSLVSGKPLEIRSAKVTGTTCSIQNGNVFGN
jgi:hypothetical protein